MRIMCVIILISKGPSFHAVGVKDGRWVEERSGRLKNGRCGWNLGVAGIREFGIATDGGIRESCISACFGRRDGV